MTEVNSCPRSEGETSDTRIGAVVCGVPSPGTGYFSAPVEIHILLEGKKL